MAGALLGISAVELAQQCRFEPDPYSAADFGAVEPGNNARKAY